MRWERCWRWPSACPSSPPFIPRGGRRGSIRSRRCVMSEPALALRRVERIYHQAGANLPVLRGAALELKTGEIVALVGPSGAGKSTLLHLAGLLERPDEGAVLLNGRPCGK